MVKIKIERHKKNENYWLEYMKWGYKTGIIKIENLGEYIPDPTKYEVVVNGKARTMSKIMYNQITEQ